MTGRIEIKKISREIIEGRQKETKADFYKCWCEAQDLSTTEKYTALQTELKETISFKVRSCKKVEEIRLNTKDFKVIYKGVEFDIYAVTPMYKDGQKVILKCNRVS